MLADTTKTTPGKQALADFGDFARPAAALPPSLIRLALVAGIVASLALLPALASAADVILDTGNTLTWTPGIEYSVGGGSPIPFTDTTLDVDGTLSYSGGASNLVNVISNGSSGGALNIDAGNTGLTFSHSSVDGSAAVIAVNSAQNTAEINYSGSAITVEANRSGNSISGNFGAFSSLGDLTIHNSGLMSLSGNFSAVNSSGAATISGNIVGLQSLNNSITISGDVLLSDITRQAESATGLADASGDIAGLYTGGEAQAGATVSLTGLKNTATAKDPGGSKAAASGIAAGVYSVNSVATADDAVELSGIERRATSQAGDADASGGVFSAAQMVGNFGVYASDDAVTQAVTLSGLKNIAETFGGGFADASGLTAGVYSRSGSATVQDAVTVSEVERWAFSREGSADASDNNGNSIFHNLPGTYGVWALDTASTQAVTLDQVSTIAEAKLGADASGSYAGVMAYGNQATAEGTITLSNLTRQAHSAEGHADASGGFIGDNNNNSIMGGNYGLYAQGEASATSVFLNNISHTAVTTGVDNDALAAAQSAGVYSAGGTATASGDVELRNISTSAQADGTGTADARLYAYGLYGLTGVSTSGNVVVQASSTASGGAGGQVWELGQAVGLMSGGVIEVNGGTDQPTLIQAEGSSQAFAISTTADPASATVTTLNGLVYLRAEAGSLDNTYTSYNGVPIGGGVQAKKDARPVSEAEYLGLGSDDTLNINPGSGRVLDNGGEALRIFGAETVNIQTGTLVLNNDSWIVNQKDFESTATGDDYGQITGDARKTELKVEDGARLVVNGRVLSEVTSAMGAHSNGLFTDSGSFSLDTDYTLNAAVETGGTLAVRSDGSMSMTNLSQAAGSDLVFSLTRLSDDTLGGGQLKVSGQATLSGSVQADLSALSVEGMLLGDLGQSTSYTVIQAGSLNTDGAALDSGQKLFYEYGFVNQNNADLVFNLKRNLTSFGSAALAGGSSVNSARAIDTLMTNANAPYIPELMAQVLDLSVGGERRVAYLAGQLHGEIAASGMEALLYYQKSQLDSLDYYLTGDFFNRPNDLLYDPDCCDSPALGDWQDQPWRFRAAFQGGRAEQDADNGFGGYDVDNYTALLALERLWDRAALGLSFSAGRTKIDYDQYNNTAEADNLNVTLYGRYNWSQAFLTGRLGYGHSSMDFNRKLPTFGLTAKGDTNVDYFSAAVRTGYDFYPENRWAISPSAGLSWIHGRMDSFVERGAGVYTLKYGSENSNSIEVQANVTIQRDFGKITPYLNLGMAYELGDTRHRLHTAFMGLPGSPAFVSESNKRSRLRFMGDLGVKATLSENVSLSLDYLTSIQNDFQSHRGQLTIQCNF